MKGGRYTTWFPDDEKRELRTLFYKLENYGLVKLDREKKKQGRYNYAWVLTKKGEDIIEENEHLKKLQKKKDTFKFFKALKDKVEEKTFFIP